MQLWLFNSYLRIKKIKDFTKPSIFTTVIVMLVLGITTSDVHILFIG